jgi:hypothetical protein
LLAGRLRQVGYVLGHAGGRQQQHANEQIRSKTQYRASPSSTSQQRCPLYQARHKLGFIQDVAGGAESLGCR